MIGSRAPQSERTSTPAGVSQRRRPHPADLRSERVARLDHGLTDFSIRPRLTVGSTQDPAETRANEAAGVAFAAPARHADAAHSASVPLPGDLAGAIASRAGEGRSLPPATRRQLEGRLGVDTGGVRAHDDGTAGVLARQLGARAFSLGNHIFLRPGGTDPREEADWWTLAHEVTHAAESTGSNQVIRRVPDDPASRALYPTPTERAGVLAIVDRQRALAAASSTQVPAVDDPAAFASEMTARMNNYIDRAVVPARQRSNSTVSIGLPVIQAVGDIAESEVRATYGSYIQAAVRSPADTAALAQPLRDHLHLISTTPTQLSHDAAISWVESRMYQEGGDLIDDHHVLGADGARDRAVFVAVRDAILAQRSADVETIVLFHPGYEGGGEAHIQGRLLPAAPNEAAEVTRRRGRWRTLDTTIHEMLHVVQHRRFREAAESLEGSKILVEGFAEYFTKPVYAALAERARGDASFRASVEGVQAPLDEALMANPPGGYQAYVDHVLEIKQLLGANEENLRVAFFLGRLEYLGLGGWNEAESGRQRFPGNTLGAAALLTDGGSGLFRIDYGRVVMGRTGALQLSLGGTIHYLTQGERLGIAGLGLVQYSGRDVFIRGSLGVGASASVTGSLSNTVRLDLLPGVEAGVRIGVARVGVGATLLIPVVGGPVSDRTTRLAAGVGASFDF